MAQIDAFTGLLPFILTYVVLYAALKEVPVIEDNDKFPPLIAIIGAFFVARFIVANPYYQDFFVTFFGKLVVGLIGFIGLLILLAFTGFEVGDSDIPLLMILMIAIAGAAFTSAGGFGPPWNLSILSSAELSSLIGFTIDSGLIWIFIVGGALLWVSGDENDGDGPTGMDFMKWMLGQNDEDT
ncbi:MAG: hypothetical protein BRC26_03740 [Nanohaloarchaea archaeon QH_8_44_6]|nr:MAG: hypothetical protein BRC26_03740 [Nanohaloarchaea archaeon QH_8_44_6]